MLLALLLACDAEPAPGHDTDAHSACLRWTSIACECGGNTPDPAQPDYYCDADNAESACADYRSDVCDTEGDAFDVEACEAYHEIDEEHALAFFNCANESYAETCVSYNETCGTP